MWPSVLTCKVVANEGRGESVRCNADGNYAYTTVKNRRILWISRRLPCMTSRWHRRCVIIGLICHIFQQARFGMSILHNLLSILSDTPRNSLSRLPAFVNDSQGPFIFGHISTEINIWPSLSAFWQFTFYKPDGLTDAPIFMFSKTSV